MAEPDFSPPPHMSRGQPFRASERFTIRKQLERELVAAERKLCEAALAYGRADTQYGLPYAETEALRIAAEVYETAHRARHEGMT